MGLLLNQNQGIKHASTECGSSDVWNAAGKRQKHTQPKNAGMKKSQECVWNVTGALSVRVGKSKDFAPYTGVVSCVNTEFVDTSVKSA